MEETEKTLHDVSCLSGPVPYPLIEMVWADATGDNGWDVADKKEYEKEMLVLTIGFLVNHNDKNVVVASTIHGEEYGTNSRIIVPIGMIRHIREIE